MRRVIGVVAQRSGADPVATGRDNLMLQGRLYGLRGAALRTPRRRAAGAVRARRRRRPAGAARTRAACSAGSTWRSGLVHRPEVLFLDEPTTGLDPEARAAMWDEIARLAGDEALAILLTTHYLEEADRLAERLAIVDRGRIVVEGTPGRSSRASCAATPSTWSCASAGGRAGRTPAPWRPCPACARSPWTGGGCSARADDGAAAVPAVLAALDEAGLAGRRGHRRPAVAGRRLPALRRPPVRSEAETAAEVPDERAVARTPGG